MFREKVNSVLKVTYFFPRTVKHFIDSAVGVEQLLMKAAYAAAVH